MLITDKIRNYDWNANNVKCEENVNICLTFNGFSDLT